MSLVAASLVALLPCALAGTSEQRSGAPSGASVSSAPTGEGSVDAAAAAHCARAAELLGKNCSYSTGTMARRVIEEGADWSFTGELVEASNDLGTNVAAPYTIADGAHVIATELVETLARQGHLRARLSLAGKLLEVDGVRYVVLTSFQVINA